MEARILEVGNRVRLNPGVSSFRHGQGRVNFGEIGTVASIYGDDIFVDFPSHGGWHGEIDELILFKPFEEVDFKCHDCGEQFEECDLILLKKLNKVVCKHCLEEKYIKCHDCGEYIEIGNEFHVDDGNYDVCGSCRYINYYECDDCGAVVLRDNINRVHGDYFCDNCMEGKEKNYIYDYHEFNNWRFYGEGKYYIGKEIELEPFRYSNRDGVLDALQHINAVGMCDGSLNSGGVEVVTHPESWDYLQKHKQDYINFFDEIESINYGNEDNCGLHFHVSRPNDEVISRIIVLLESFKDEIIKLSRRSSSDLENWACFYSDKTHDNFKKLQYKSKKYVKEEVLNHGFGRYMALNLENCHTIEFRFFDGVNNFEEFWGALQFIHNLMEVAMDEKRELNTINWKDLIYGTELVNQAKTLGVWNIDKFAKDTTEILKEYKEKLDKTKKEVRRILRNWARRINKDMSEMDIKELKSSDLGKMQEKYEKFMRNFNYKKNFLDRITSIYNYLGGDFSLEQTKEYLKSTKNNYPHNFKQYERYEKLLNKEIDKFEKEMK